MGNVVTTVCAWAGTVMLSLTVRKKGDSKFLSTKHLEEVVHILITPYYDALTDVIFLSPWQASSLLRIYQPNTKQPGVSPIGQIRSCSWIKRFRDTS